MLFSAVSLDFGLLDYFLDYRAGEKEDCLTPNPFDPPAGKNCPASFLPSSAAHHLRIETKPRTAALQH
jgi:hypothetical protein